MPGLASPRPSLHSNEECSVPTLIRPVSEILAERQADTLFVQFKASKGRRLRSSSDNSDASAIFEWLDARSIKYELACPDGHLEGYTGLYAIHFPTLTNPLYLKFLNEFETSDGKSKKPTSYVLLIAK